MQPRLGRLGATALTTLALIVLGASSVDASAAVADASAGGSEVGAVGAGRAVGRGGQRFGARGPRPAAQCLRWRRCPRRRAPGWEARSTQAGLPTPGRWRPRTAVIDEVEASVERSIRVLERPAFRSAGRRRALQTPSGRAAMSGASSVDASTEAADTNVPGSNDLDPARLQALVKQLESTADKDRGGGHRSWRRSKKELAAPQPMSAEEPAHIESTIQSIPQEGFPNADEAIIVFDEAEASVERALRHLMPAPSPGASSLRDQGSGEMGSGEDLMLCSSCANSNAGGVCLVPLAGSECPVEYGTTYANCSAPMVVGDVCEADGELSTNTTLSHCAMRLDSDMAPGDNNMFYQSLYKRIECRDATPTTPSHCAWRLDSAVAPGGNNWFYKSLYKRIECRDALPAMGTLGTLGCRGPTALALAPRARLHAPAGHRHPNRRQLQGGGRRERFRSGEARRHQGAAPGALLVLPPGMLLHAACDAGKRESGA